MCALLTTEYMKMVYLGIELKAVYSRCDKLEFVSYLMQATPNQALLSLEGQTLTSCCRGNDPK